MNETIRNITTRKSCRSFTGERLTKAQLDTLVAAGLNAPSAKNTQTPIFVVLQDQDTIAYLSKLNAAVMGTDSDPFYGARDVILVLAKVTPNCKYDGALAMGNLMNAAYAMGLGSCWINRAKEIFESAEGKALLEKWGITEEVEGIGFCILGYQDKEKPDKAINPGRVYYV